MHLKLKYVYYIEVFINICVAFISLFFPTYLFDMLFGAKIEFDHFSINLSYWYVVVLIVISYIMLKSLLTANQKAMLIVLEGYLLGDILQLLVIFIRIPWGLHFNLGILFTVIFTFILIISRITVLIRPEYLGFTK
jgi:hypothetical protein